MRDTVEARQSLKRSRGLGGSRLAGRSLLFNYVQTGPLTRFRTGLAPSAGPAQLAQCVTKCATQLRPNSTSPREMRRCQPVVIFRGPNLRWTSEVLLGLALKSKYTSINPFRPFSKSPARLGCSPPQFIANYIANVRIVGNYCCPGDFPPADWLTVRRVLRRVQNIVPSR